MGFNYSEKSGLLVGQGNRQAARHNKTAICEDGGFCKLFSRQKF